MAPLYKFHTPKLEISFISLTQNYLFETTNFFFNYLIYHNCISIGSMKCPFCEEKGIKASITLPNSAFSYPKASVRFEPQSKLNVDLSFDIFGGLLIRIDKKKLQHQLRKFADKTNIPKKLESLYAVLTQLKLRTDVGIIRKYCIPMHNSFNILYLKSKQKESSYESIAKLLHVSREAADDCVSQLRYLKARYLDEKSIVRKIVPLLSHSKAIYRLNLDVNTKPFESLEQGKIISYEGRFCLHSLCLNDMNVTIYDLSEDMLSQPKCNVSCVYRYKPLLRKEAITIDAIATKEMNMSSRIKIDSGSNVRLWVDKFNDQLKGKYFEQFCPRLADNDVTCVSVGRTGQVCIILFIFG